MRVELVDMMGDDRTVVNSARVSFANEIAEGDFSNRDAKLIKYLARHDHWTPFAHVQCQFRIKAPIFVARQLVKHQVGLVWNEVSRRYVDYEPSFHAPYFWRKRADNKKQGSSDEIISEDTGLFATYWDLITRAEEAYNYFLERGVAPEQARIILPQSLMTEWIWTGSLVAFARVVKLRLSEDAQFECRAIAERIKSELDQQDKIKHSWSELCQ